MVGEDQGVRVPADRADATEQDLEAGGRCNWLTDYGVTFRVYCGAPAADGLCAGHAHNLYLGVEGGPGPDQDGTRG